jgi:hypothetical protein
MLSKSGVLESNDAVQIDNVHILPAQEENTQARSDIQDKWHDR